MLETLVAAPRRYGTVIFSDIIWLNATLSMFFTSDGSIQLGRNTIRSTKRARACHSMHVMNPTEKYETISKGSPKRTLAVMQSLRNLIKFSKSNISEDARHQAAWALSVGNHEA